MRKSECDFFKCTRVTKKTFSFLVGEMERTERFSSTQRPPRRGTPPTAPATALAVTLWYLGTQSAQRDIAERFDISQGHLSVIVKDVVDFLCGLSQAVIRWPTEPQMNDVEEQFSNLAQFPGVIGAIDGCHIPISAPDYCQNDYLDRNHTHSVNLMAVCDANKKITYCFAGYPGSVHGQSLCQLCTRASRGHFLPPAIPEQPLSHSGRLGISAATTCDGAVQRHWCLNCSAAAL